MDIKKEKVEEVSISVEDRNTVFKGIRPDDMDYNVFRQVRKDIEIARKRYLGGQFKHISVNFDPMFKDSIDVKGTYVRNTNKRYEGIRRKWELNKNK